MSNAEPAGGRKELSGSYPEADDLFMSDAWLA